MTPQEKLAQQVQILEGLAVADRALRRFESQITEGQGTIDSLRTELAQLDEKLALDQKSAEEMQATAGELSTEARQMSVQLEKSRDKLGRARNDREVMNAEREQDELRKMQRDREDEVAKLGKLLDAAKESIAATQAKRDRIHRELTENESATGSSLGEARQEREKILAERAEIAKKLPVPLLKRYEAVLKKKGTALARTTGGTCEACHVSLPPQFFQKLQRRETLEECPMCHRILYYQQPEKQP